MDLVPVTVDQADELDPSEFPLVAEYLGDGFRGEYWDEKYQWFFITDLEFKDPVIGAACLTTNRVLPGSLHISIFEVKSSLRGGGLGSKAMRKILEMAGTVFLSVTLRPREPDLVKFYERFGFKLSRIDGCDYMRKYRPFIND